MRKEWVVAAALFAVVAVTGCSKKDDNAAPPKSDGGTKKSEGTKPGTTAAAGDMNPKETLVAFGNALEKGDLAAAKAVCVSDPTSEAFLEATVPMATGIRHLKDVATAKFGEAGSEIAGDKDGSLDFVKNVENMEFKETGDTCEAVNKTRANDHTLLKKVCGKWKLDPVGSIAKDNPGVDATKMLPMFRAMTTAMNEAAADIEAGKFATAAEARKGVEAKVSAAVMANAPKGDNVTMNTAPHGTEGTPAEGEKHD